MVGIGRGRREKLEKFSRKFGPTYPIAVEAGHVFHAWDVEAVPESFLVAPDGTILASSIDDAERALSERAARPAEPSGVSPS